MECDNRKWYKTAYKRFANQILFLMSFEIVILENTQITGLSSLWKNVIK